MAVKKVYLTASGADAEAYAKANNQTLNFSRFAIGDGENDTPENGEMKNECYSLSINMIKDMGDGIFKLRGGFDNSILTSDFLYRELGLYITDPKDSRREILFLYGNAKTAEGDYTETIPAFSGSGNAVSRLFDIDVRITGGSATFTLDDSQKADVVTVAELREDLTAEIAARENADSAEATARANADKTLQSNISAEATARANADKTLQSNISAEATARANADSAEATARAAADKTLQGNIDAEASARASADTTLQANINKKVDKVSGKGLSTNDYTTTEKNKLAGIATGANAYAHPTTSGNKHIPSGGSSGQILRWSADGTAAWGADNNTTYSNFVKSGSGAKAGLVPAPSTTAGTTKYLREDGTWQIPPDTNTTYSNATQSASGLMSANDKTKLDGIATGANKTTVDSALSSTSTNPVQNKVINSALSGKANSSHTHDDRYYTETEINTKLSGKSDTTHTHDDRYYTETEINTKLSCIRELDWANKVEFQNYAKTAATGGKLPAIYASNIVTSGVPYIYGVNFTAPKNGMFIFKTPYRDDPPIDFWYGGYPRNNVSGHALSLKTKNGEVINLGGGIYLNSAANTDGSAVFVLVYQAPFEKIIPCNEGDELFTYMYITTSAPYACENYLGDWYFVPYKEA